MQFQLGSTLLDACVLAVVSKEDVYGYILTQSIQAVIDVSESALYPVLRRLQKDGCLTTYDQPYQGRNRRYYAITSQGQERLQGYAQEWTLYKAKIDQLLGGAQNAGNE